LPQPAHAYFTPSLTSYVDDWHVPLAEYVVHSLYVRPSEPQLVDALHVVLGLLDVRLLQ
jgi:hypothetical protein